MITLTDSAVKHLKGLLAQRAAEEGAGLRLQVERGGCAGMQYTMKIDKPSVEDRVFSEGGVTLIVDHGSLGFLDNSRIDYVDSLNDSGFKVDNPNVARSCGCGTSFEPKPNE